MTKEGITPIKFIERIGRTCYKSTDLIKEGSAKDFVRGLIKRKHYAMLEHYNVIVAFSNDGYNYFKSFKEDFELMRKDGFKYFDTTLSQGAEPTLVSGSVRAWLELFHLVASTNRTTLRNSPLKPLVEVFFRDEDLEFMFDEGEFTQYSYVYSEDDLPCNISFKDFSIIAEKDLNTLLSMYIKDKDRVAEILSTHITHTMKFICDRGVSHEFVRHRNCAFAQESTRYCNYSKDKFGKEITLIEPCYFRETWGNAEEDNLDKYNLWLDACRKAEKTYFELLELGATPQEARAVLPNSLKTELIITAKEKEWKHIIDLRLMGTTGKPHPQMELIMSIATPTLILMSDGRLG